VEKDARRKGFFLVAQKAAAAARLAALLEHFGMSFDVDTFTSCSSM